MRFSCVRCFWFGLFLIPAPWVFSYTSVAAIETDPVPVTAGEMVRYLHRPHAAACRDDAVEDVADGGSPRALKKCYSSGALVDDYAKCPPAPPITTTDHSYY